MNIIKTKKLNNLQYYPVFSKKEQIFLHHTGGLSAQSAIDWWNQTPEHVGTSFIIDRDGTIYEVFPRENWAYHLGIKNDDNLLEKSSIGIELVAAGPLYKENDGKFYFYPIYPSKLIKKVINPEDIWELKEGWRGSKYYHKYTDAQITSLIELIKELIQEFGIEVQKDIKDFHIYNEIIYSQHLKGIWSHSSVRQDKNDIVPHQDLIDKLSTLLPIEQSTQMVSNQVKPFTRLESIKNRRK